MIIRKPIPRAHGLHEPLRHPDHPKPRTRREFISQGFMAGGAMAFVPSTLAFLLANPRVADALSSDISALKAVCNISNGAGRVPFICFDLSGGANLVGSEVLVGQQQGQMDFLTTAGYGKLGLPPPFIPTASATGNNIDQRLGLAFQADSALLRGMMTRISATTAANINGCVMPVISQNDTQNNVWNPLYQLALTGVKGSLLTLAGSSNSTSGGSSIANPMYVNPTLQPTKISQPSDLTGLAPGSGPTLFTGPSAQEDMVAVLESVERTTKMKLDAIDTLLGAGTGPNSDAGAKQIVQCDFVKPANTAEIFSGPQALDIMQDPNITGTPTSIFTAAEITQRDFAQVSTIMKLIVNGFGGAAVNQMGGFDYHTGNRMDGEGRNFNAGVCMGACLEYAARVGQPLMLQVFSDGSLSSTMTIDNSVGGRGKYGWQNDNQAVAATFFLVYSPKGRPALLGADKQQLGYFSADGNVVASSSPGANAVNLAVEMIVLNYLGLNGMQGQMPNFFPNTAFGSTALIDQYTAFGKI